MKLYDDKKRCNTYRAIQKTHFNKEHFEDFGVFLSVFLHYMCTIFVLPADLLRSPEDNLDEKRDGKINFFVE